MFQLGLDPWAGGRAGCGLRANTAARPRIGGVGGTAAGNATRRACACRAVDRTGFRPLGADARHLHLYYH